MALYVLSGRLLIQALIDTPDLSDPALPLAMLHLHDLIVGPMQMVRNICYLLVQAIRGVAGYSPRPAVSTSNSPWQCGQATSSRV